MHRSLVFRQSLPAVSLLVGLLAGAVLVDATLHVLGLGWVGLWLGPVGTFLLLASFAYSARKRKRISWGQPKQLLELHQTLGWTGSLAILVHGGGHFSAVLPWLAAVSMVVVAASGIVGAVLLRRALEMVRRDGAAPADSTRAVLDAVTLDLMKRWRAVHMPLNAVFVVLASLHILAVLLLRSW